MLSDWLKTVAQNGLAKWTATLSPAHQEVVRRSIIDGVDLALIGAEVLGQKFLAAKYPQIASVLSDVSGLDFRTVPATPVAAAV
jgi:hypothetical protein